MLPLGRKLKLHLHPNEINQKCKSEEDILLQKFIFVLRSHYLGCNYTKVAKTYMQVGTVPSSAQAWGGFSAEQSKEGGGELSTRHILDSPQLCKMRRERWRVEGRDGCSVGHCYESGIEGSERCQVTDICFCLFTFLLKDEIISDLI